MNAAIVLQDDIESSSKNSFTPGDLNVLRSLEQEYNQAAQASTVDNKARRSWARSAATASILFILSYFLVGVIFFQIITEWPLLHTILFAVYTATSAGFGHVETPTDNPWFLIFDIIYILVGIAALAIMVAQIFQFLELEASRVHHKLQTAELRDPSSRHTLRLRCWHQIERIQSWIHNTVVGRVFSVWLPLTLMMLLGAVPIGIIEGWNFLQILYFGIVAMTTVGYGDLVPQTSAGVILCFLWLPLNILFTSVYMGSVASWYLRLANTSIQKRKEALLTEQMELNEAQVAESLRPQARPHHLEKITEEEVGSIASSILSEKIEDPGEVSPEESLRTTDSSSASSECDNHCVQQQLVLLENLTSSLTTMEDVVRAIRSGQINSLVNGEKDGLSVTASIQNMLVTSTNGKPSFALRVLVKERLAAIIALEIAGGRHTVDVEDNFIVVRIGEWRDVVTKWHIPPGAWKAFRAASLESIMVVGERKLLNVGKRSILQLSPDEVHGMFSPVVAAMGGADTLQAWLESTETLANGLAEGGSSRSIAMFETRKHQKLSVSDDSVNMPKSQATAFHR